MSQGPGQRVLLNLSQLLLIRKSLKIQNVKRPDEDECDVTVRHAAREAGDR